jgi:hypothetical protein
VASILALEGGRVRAEGAHDSIGYFVPAVGAGRIETRDLEVGWCRRDHNSPQMCHCGGGFAPSVRELEVECREIGHLGQEPRRLVLSSAAFCEALSCLGASARSEVCHRTTTGNDGFPKERL